MALRSCLARPGNAGSVRVAQAGVARRISLRTRVATQPLPPPSSSSYPCANRSRSILCRSESNDSAEINPSCRIDGDFSGCSLKDLEMMYVNAVWNYYQDPDKAMPNADYDRLKLELNFQASGFADLNRREVQFVNASIAFQQGKPIMSDEDYEALKSEVKASGKRAEVTALLLTVKGQEFLTPAQYEILAEEMYKLGIPMSIEGQSCTLTQTPDDLTLDVQSLAIMYLGIAAIPTLLFGVGPWVGLDILTKGGVPFAAGLGWTVVGGAALTLQMVKYMGLNNAEILVGQCPCCETEVKCLFSGDNPNESEKLKCTNCGAKVELVRTTKKVVNLTV